MVEASWSRHARNDVVGMTRRFEQALAQVEAR